MADAAATPQPQPADDEQATPAADQQPQQPASQGTDDDGIKPDSIYNG
jgi:hypothetical protein